MWLLQHMQCWLYTVLVIQVSYAVKVIWMCRVDAWIPHRVITIRLLTDRYSSTSWDNTQRWGQFWWLDWALSRHQAVLAASKIFNSHKYMCPANPPPSYTIKALNLDQQWAIQVEGAILATNAREYCSCPTRRLVPLLYIDPTQSQILQFKQTPTLVKGLRKDLNSQAPILGLLTTSKEWSTLEFCCIYH